jgi:hypothetical protein
LQLFSPYAAEHEEDGYLWPQERHHFTATGAYEDYLRGLAREFDPKSRRSNPAPHLREGSAMSDNVHELPRQAEPTSDLLRMEGSGRHLPHAPVGRRA